MNSSHLMLMAIEADRQRTAERYRQAAARHGHAVGRLRRALRLPAARTRRVATGPTATADAAM